MRDRLPTWLPAALLAAVLGWPLPGGAQPELLADPRPRANDAQLRHALERVRLAHRVPGLAAVVFDRETVRAFATGELEPGGGPVTPESRFQAGQLSLLFTGIATAGLVADGSLAANAELRRLAPELDIHNPWSGERTIRVDDLVSHRAGLGATHFRDVYAEADAQPLLAGINSAFRALRLAHPPGEREQYSVVGHAIAAYLVEKSVGRPYEDVLARLLFAPLELDASLGRPAGPLPADSAGHRGWPAQRVESRALNFPPAGEIWLSAEDLGKVGRLLLNRGRAGERQLLPAGAVEWLESSPEDVATLTPGSRRGVRAEEFAGFVFYTQSGALPGFLARFAYSPELGAGYAVLLNRGDADTALRDADMLLRGQLFGPGVQPGPVPAPATEVVGAQRLAGWYRDVTPAHPPERLYRSWLGFLRAAPCEEFLCLAGPSVEARLQAVDDTRLREVGHWLPGWAWRDTATGAWLETADSTWVPVSGGKVGAALFAGLFVVAGLLLGVLLLPVWTWSLVRRQITDYHELVPRLVPLAGVLCVVALQVLLFTTDYPALGRVSTPTVTILVLSILAPLLGVLALAAALAGWKWKLPRAAFATALYLALAVNGAVIAMGVNGLVAFQAWNY